MDTAILVLRWIAVLPGAVLVATFARVIVGAFDYFITETRLGSGRAALSS